MNESPFVGTDRQLLVDQLSRVVRDASQMQQARWVSLEAEVGTGKTRVLKEVYAQIASAQKSHYWPSSISLAGNIATPAAERKSINPEFLYSPETTPEFVWWGINCATRGGSPVDALAADIIRLRLHMPHINRSMTAAQPVFKRAVQAAAKIAFSPATDAAQDELLGAVSAAAGMQESALAVLSSIARNTYSVASDHIRARREYHGIASTPDPNEQFIDQCLNMVSTIASSLPFVLVIEDLHQADDVLIQFLSQLISLNSGVTIFSTSLPGFIDRNETLVETINAWDGERTTRVSRRKSSPMRIKRYQAIDRLSDTDLAAIASSHLDAPEATLTKICARYPQPLALELFCSLHRIQRELGITGDVSNAEIERHPSELVALYTEHWNELDREQRMALALAARFTPSLQLDWAQSSFWHAEVIIDLLMDAPRDDVSEQAVTWLTLANDRYRWSDRSATNPLLGTFVEIEQGIVALHDSNFFTKK